MTRPDVAIDRPHFQRFLALSASLMLLVTGFIGVFGTLDTGMAGASPVSTGSISGTVTDHAGHPVSGVEISATDDYGSTNYPATTSANGTYTITGLPASPTCTSGEAPADCDYVFTVTPSAGTDVYDQFEHPIAPVALAAGQNVTGVDTQLVEPGSISGTVTDSSHNPLSNASILIESVDGQGNISQQGFSVTTDSSGHYEVSGLAPNSADIVEMDPNNGTGLDQWYNHAFASSAGAKVAVTAGAATTGIDFADQSGVTVSGILSDTSGSPVSGGTLTFSMVSGATGTSNGGVASVNSDGTFTATDIAPGNWTATYDPDGTPGVVSTTFENPFQVGSANISGLSFRASSSAPSDGTNEVEGRIVDSNGNPIAGMQVSVYSSTNDSAPTYAATTGADGTYQVNGIPAWDNYYLRAYDPNGTYAAFDLAGLRLDDGDTTDGSVGFTTNNVYVMNATLPKYAHVTGTITDNQGHEVTDLMNIALIDPATGNVDSIAQNTYRDPNHPGYYTTSVDPGTYLIEYVDVQSYPPPLATQWWQNAADQAHATPVTFAEGQSLNFNVTMQPTPQAPGAPTGVTATAGNTQATIAWTAPASNGGSAITGYTVTSAPGAKTCTTTGALTCTITGLTNGTAYIFTVAASNAIGTGDTSTPSKAVTPAAPATAPGAPTGVTATAGHASANVSWTAPASNGGSAITGYTVTPYVAGVAQTPTVVNGTLTSTTISGLTNGTAYTDFLGRPPTAAEEYHWVTLLGSGTSRNSFTTYLATSNEWINHIVTGFYLDTLGRGPDTAGLAYWDNVIATGKQSVATVAAEFYSSNEYFQAIAHGSVATWVGDLYTKVLHRTSDPSGLTFWESAAAANGRQYVAEEIYQSNESRSDRVTTLYQELLHRSPESSGLAYWTGKLLTVGDIALAEQLADSPEYYALAHTRFP